MSKQKNLNTIKPFLSSISYLVQEASRLGLAKIQRICSGAEEELSRYVIDELLNPEDGKRVMISESDYKYISEIIVAVSRMSPSQIEAFIRALDQHETEMNTVEELQITH